MSLNQRHTFQMSICGFCYLSFERCQGIPLRLPSVCSAGQARGRARKEQGENLDGCYYFLLV
jgi:hypothetical protein